MCVENFHMRSIIFLRGITSLTLSHCTNAASSYCIGIEQASPVSCCLLASIQSGWQAQPDLNGLQPQDVVCPYQVPLSPLCLQGAWPERKYVVSQNSFFAPLQREREVFITRSLKQWTIIDDTLQSPLPSLGRKHSYKPFVPHLWGNYILDRLAMPYPSHAVCTLRSVSQCHVLAKCHCSHSIWSVLDVHACCVHLCTRPHKPVVACVITLQQKK